MTYDKEQHSTYQCFFHEFSATRKCGKNSVVKRLSELNLDSQI